MTVLCKNELDLNAIQRRRVTAMDTDFLYRLYRSTRETELAAFPWSDAEKESFLEMQFAAQTTHYQTHFSNATREILCADDEPLGRLYVHRTDSDMRIVDISLLPHVRGLGIGTGLLTELIKESEASQKPLRIHVEQYNPALSLYERMGFRFIELNGVYYLMERPC